MLLSEGCGGWFAPRAGAVELSVHQAHETETLPESEAAESRFPLPGPECFLAHPRSAFFPVTSSKRSK